MGRTLTLTFDGKNELLLKAIEAYAQADLFEDEEGKSVQLSAEEVAMNMLMEGCLEWVQDVAGLPEDLEQQIFEEFEMGEEEGCDEEGCEQDHGHMNN